MKIFNILTITLLFFTVTLNAYPNPKEFSGIIVYNISYEGDQVNEQMMAMVPKTMKMMIKENKVRTEMNMGMGSQVMIVDSEAKTGTILMDMMGQKMAISLTPDYFDEQTKDANDVEVIETGNTKEIAGYTCKEALVKVKDEKSEFTVFYTDELGSGALNIDNPYAEHIDGVMLEFSTEDKKMKMKMKFSAISVDKKKISDKEFEVPEGYQEMSVDQYKSMQGGGY